MPTKIISRKEITFRSIAEWKREYFPSEAQTTVREDRYTGKPDELGTALANKAIQKLNTSPKKEMASG